MSADFTGSNALGIVDAISAALVAAKPQRPIVVEIGTLEASAKKAPPRVTLVPQKKQRRNPDQQRPDGRVICYYATQFRVVAHGRTYDEAEQLVDDLERALFPYGPNAFEIGDWDPAPDVLFTNGFAWIGRVATRVPTFEQLYQRVTLGPGVVAGGVRASAGGTPEQMEIPDP